MARVQGTTGSKGGKLLKGPDVNPAALEHATAHGVDGIGAVIKVKPAKGKAVTFSVKGIASLKRDGTMRSVATRVNNLAGALADMYSTDTEEVNSKGRPKLAPGAEVSSVALVMNQRPLGTDYVSVRGTSARRAAAALAPSAKLRDRATALAVEAEEYAATLSA
jgi:hypothetical protein